MLGFNQQKIIQEILQILKLKTNSDMINCIEHRRVQSKAKLVQLNASAFTVPCAVEIPSYFLVVSGLQTQ